MPRIQFEFDPEEETGVTIPKAVRDEAYEEVANYVRESVLSDCGDGISPVTGRPFAKLSKAYKKRKEEEGAPGIANLELHGDMLDSVDVVRARGKKLRIQVSDDQNDKADGHCNFSGKSDLPLRRFIPFAKDGETFRRGIVDGVRSILLAYAEGDDNAD